ncbi:MAG: mucoidy inhibitor MuiA family protein [Bacteroidetes bacterium]|nr:mucoidy inhibitor MuiA family protein [Bacteroidota bacterium]
MKNRFFLAITTFFIVQTSFGQNSSLAVDSKIKNVTVFLSGAQISRTATTPLSKGRNELLFKGISPNIDKESIQLSGEGKFTIVSVAHQYNFLEETNSKEQVKQLMEQSKKYKEQIEDLTIQIDVFKAEEQMLVKNQEIGGSNTGVKASDLKESVDFQRLRMTEVKSKILENNRAITKINLEYNKVLKQINELQAKRYDPLSEIVVVVEAFDATKAEFDLSYFVSSAGWTPSYDLKVEQLNQPINLKYKASVFQSTGEDWNNIKLTLSTGDPQLGGEKPTISSWYLGQLPPYMVKKEKDANKNIRQVSGLVYDSNTNEPLIGVTVSVVGTSFGTTTDLDGKYTIAIPIGVSQLTFSYVGYTDITRNITGNLMNVNMIEDAQILEEIVVSASNNLSGMLEGSTPGLYYSSKVKKLKSEYKSLGIEENYQPTTVSFTIEKNYTILSDGESNSVEIKDVLIPADYQYYCAPAFDKDAFLTAKIIDWESLNLLEGEANLFFEGTYLGKSLINPMINTDTMEISLGRDKGIQITRVKLKDFSKKQFLGSNRIEQRTWEISVRNNKKQPINLILQDQYPISNRKEISVERIENEGAILDEIEGFLTWNLNIMPSTEKKVMFKFLVKYPSNLDIFIP